MEHIVVYCYGVCEPEGKIWDSGLVIDRSAIADGGALKVCEKDSRLKVCDIPYDRAQKIVALENAGMIEVAVECAGPIRRKELIRAVVAIDVKADLGESPRTILEPRLYAAFREGKSGSELRAFLDGISGEFRNNPQPFSACLAYWMLWGRLGLSDEYDPVIILPKRLNPEGIDAIKARGKREGQAPCYLSLAPEDVREDIVRRLVGYQVEIHTDREPEFDYLEDEFSFVVTVKNPNSGGEDLELEFAGEFTVFFGACHTHYESDVERYEGWFLEEVFGVLSGEVSALSAWRGDKWFGSVFVKKPLHRDMGFDELLSHLEPFPAEFKKELVQSGGYIKVRNWIPEKSFDVECD